MTGMAPGRKRLAVRPDRSILRCIRCLESIFESFIEESARNKTSGLFAKSVSPGALTGIVQPLLDRSGDFV
jgi:hypothetical protein